MLIVVEKHYEVRACCNKNHSSYQTLLKERKERTECKINSKYCYWYHTTFTSWREKGRRFSIFFAGSSRFPHSFWRLIIFSPFLWNLIIKKKTEKKRKLFGKVQNFFSPNRNNENESIFHFLSLSLSTSDTHTNNRRNIVRGIDGDTRFI